MQPTQNPEHTSPLIAMLCEIVLILCLLSTGCGVALVIYSITVPPELSPNSLGTIDVIFEIEIMTFILNITLPLSVVALCVWIWSKTRASKLNWMMLLSLITGFVAVFTCAFAMWAGLVAMHPGADLWTQIWWRK